MSLLSQPELELRAAALRERLNSRPPTSWLPWQQEAHPRELVGWLCARRSGPTGSYGETPCRVLRDLDGITLPASS